MKEILKPYYNLDEVFESGKFKIVNIGELNVTSGKIICCDPLVSLVNGEGEAFVEEIPTGKYPVTLAVLDDEEWGIRYMGARLNVSNEKTEYYQLALQKNDDISELSRENKEFWIFCRCWNGVLCRYRSSKINSRIYKENGRRFRF